jgi:lipopolysaccharide heptosyltransferase II
MTKILILRYGTIGDSIYASAFYRELRKSLPDAQIDVLVDYVANQIMEYCPYINNIFQIKGKYKNFFEYLSLFKNYDSIYLLKSDFFFSIVAFLAGVKNRIGFNLFRNKFLTQKIPYNLKKHEIDLYLDLLKKSNFEISSDKTEVWINPQSIEKVKSKIKNTSSKKICIQVYSRFTQKNWIDEYWIQVTKYLINECCADVYFIGGEQDKIQYESLIELMKDELKTIPKNLCGEFSIQDSMAFIKEMDLLIGIDSGLSHVAAALEIPQIWINGPTSITRWQPRNEKCTIISENFECSPCCLEPAKKELCKNKTSRCMKALKPQKVIDAINEFLF